MAANLLNHDFKQKLYKFDQDEMSSETTEYHSDTTEYYSLCDSDLEDFNDETNDTPSLTYESDSDWDDWYETNSDLNDDQDYGTPICAIQTNGLGVTMPTHDVLLCDGGAAADACPPHYASHFPMRSDPETLEKIRSLGLRTADGTALKPLGKRLVHYVGVDHSGKTYHYSIDYMVTNTPFPIVCES